jgi:ubiquinone/menaquinone biosynthesis C-methylase UbiE
MASTETTVERAAAGAHPLPPTGERLLTDAWDDTTLEHLHRYGVALDFCRGRRVLDIASGEGYGSNLLAGVAEGVTGVDISEEAVAHARAKYRRPNLEYLRGSADDIPLAAAAVDTVVSFETIEHHDRHAEMMAEFRRVLRPGGVLVISSPDKLHCSDLTGMNNPFHVKELYREEFHALVRDHFRHVEPLSQRIVYGSLIAPEGGARDFREYEGGFEEVRASGQLRGPIYNLCVASDAPLAPLPVSFYGGWRVFEAAVKAAHLSATEAQRRHQEREVRALLDSPTFKLGRALTWPLRKIMGR